MSKDINWTLKDELIKSDFFKLIKKLMGHGLGSYF